MGFTGDPASLARDNIFNHTHGLQGHGYIAREVECLELQRGGGRIFFPRAREGAKIFSRRKRGAKKISRPLRGAEKIDDCRSQIQSPPLPVKNYTSLNKTPEKNKGVIPCQTYNFNVSPFMLYSL